MLYLLDTNIVSELWKGARGDPAVAAWEQAELIPHGGAISVITIGELRKGLELIARRAPQQSRRLEYWLTGLCQDFANRILPVSRDVAEACLHSASHRDASIDRKPVFDARRSGVWATPARIGFKSTRTSRAIHACALG